MAGDRVEIGVEDAVAAFRAAGIAGRIVGNADVTTDGPFVRLRAIDGAAALPPLLRALDAAGVPATSAEVKRPTLDDVFLELTGRSLRDEGDLTAARPPTTEPSASPWRPRHDPRHQHRHRPAAPAPADVA